MSLSDIAKALLARRSLRPAFHFKLGPGKRDRVVAAWIDQQIEEGMPVSDRIKDMIFETITGTSSITGRPIVQMIAAVQTTQPQQPYNDNPEFAAVADALMSMGD